MMEDLNILERIQDNWGLVREEVAAATAASGRTPDEVTVIGVTKYVDAAYTAMLIQAGCADLGENRPQVLWSKAESPGFPSNIRWHMIGHLQTNKVRRLLRYQPLIHSVDSERLLGVIAKESVAREVKTRVLLEVNISGDAEKTGMSATQLEELMQQPIPEGIEVVGLMAMAGLAADSGQIQRQFDAVRELRDHLVTASGLALPELSMGMSRDYHIAIEQGATIVRVGSSLFEGIPRF